MSQQITPPKLETLSDGKLEINSLINLIDWFLKYDQKTAIMRHPQVEELFQWKQKDEIESGNQEYVFENAETRFAVGVFEALRENDSEVKLQEWITYLVYVLSEAKQIREEFVSSYDLETKEVSFIQESEKLPTEAEKRAFLTSAWLEAICTAEARILGWIYQELYNKPFQMLY
ncbi:MAG: hypothetical protein N2Z23_07535 [Pyrinomonadaceae bacterium]|nr:hypothetical protein [Pyrinomonadaceae bacterium]MCX7640276.1 hypothetical protein [Pyrinomonadaceae bacterium]MDW8305276.1 hypothetical protein [Acidobacteriota bacterium]